MNYNLPTLRTRVAIAGLLLCSSGSLLAQLHVGAYLSDYHGVQISCAHLSNGTITLSVTGGTTPYTYLWNTGATTANLTGLPSGTYSVTVKDAAIPQHTATQSWILHEPGPIDPSATPYEYPNGYNVSCFTCYNGSIAVTVGGGTTPYSYSWNDGATTEDRTSLGMGNYQLTVTDVNGCTGTSSSVYLDEPERADWTMTGNTGSNPPTQFIGTSDNKDLVFKANGSERLRLKSSGAIQVPSVAPSVGRTLLMADSLGNILKWDVTATYSKPCSSYPILGSDPWVLCGNQVDESGGVLGTTNEAPLMFMTDASIKMILDENGKVGFGTVPPSGAIDNYRVYVEDGIVTRDVFVKLGTWPDYVFNDDYTLMPLDQYKAYVESYHHLPGFPSATEVESKGGVEVGDLQRRLLQSAEEQALYILDLKRELDAMKARLSALESKQ